MMRNKTTESPSLAEFARALCGFFVASSIGLLGTVACAGTVTPPDSTPVYADEIPSGIEPVQVEHQSTARPNPQTVSTDSSRAVTPPHPAAGEPTARSAPAEGGPSTKKAAGEDEAPAPPPATE